ncbi:MAG: PASTA domain-containing protein [Dysgonomonas sp.]
MEKKSVAKGFLSNIYVKNILLIIIAFVALVVLVLVGLNLYTRHGESIKVPSVKGLQVEEARGILKAAQLECIVSDSSYQKEGVPGAILEQIPKDLSNVKKGRTIFLIIKARGEQMIPVPELKDYSVRQAEAQLNSLGFSRLVIEEVPSAYAGIVISVSYKGKALTPNQKVPKGSTLKLTVGAGGESLQDTTIQEETNIEESFFE